MVNNKAYTNIAKDYEHAINETFIESLKSKNQFIEHKDSDGQAVLVEDTNMSLKNFLQPNIDRVGQLARGFIGVFCIVIGIILAVVLKWWVGLIFIIAGLFTVFESAAKWCVFRACGIKTKY